MTQRAILFDLDGTLVDSVPDLAAAVNGLLAELDRPALGLAQVTSMVGDGTSALVERALAASGAAGTPLRAAHDRFLALYEADPTRLTRPYPGVPAVLDQLAAAGWRLGVCTNKPERATRAVLTGLDLDGFFAVVLGGDSGPTRKPDPGPLHAALGRLGSAPGNAAMIGDHRNDVVAAQAAGMPVVFARYGYGAATLAGLTPDAGIDRFAELPQALRLIWQRRTAPPER
ncbi:MAG TPA: phosphoglycolate phosphatase [Stellaceae bacterium]|nr:phosphoglycolate phosphatase [Stellaceae bacterium]